MANVKITDLTELAAVDIATNDVLPIVDINNDSTKKVTIESLTTSIAAANDYATYISLNANIDLVQDNVASVTVGTAADTETRLNANLDIVQDNVATNATDITSVETRRADNTTIFINAFTGTNTNIDTVSANADAYLVQLNANIDVVQDNVTAQNSYITSTYATLLLLDSVSDNVGSAESNVSAVEARRASNTFYDYTANFNVLVTANVEPQQNNIYSLGAPDLVWKDLHVGPGSIFLGDLTLAPNDDATGIVITAADATTTTIDTSVANVTANLNLLQDNVAAAESNVVSAEVRLNANLDVIQDNVSAIVDATAVETRLNANLDIVQDNVTTLTTTVDNFGTSSNANAAALALEDVALQTRLGANVTSLQNEDIALQARISANALVAASNDYVTYTRLDANVSAVQDNVAAAEANIAAIIDGTTEFTGDVVMQQALTVSGNLYVIGAQVDLGISSAQIDDATLLLAANTPADAQLGVDSGIVINRGQDANVFFGFAQYGDHIDFIFTDAPADNTVHYPIQYVDVHANTFGTEATTTAAFTAFHDTDAVNTGIYWPESNIGFSVGGVNKANIYTDGISAHGVYSQGVELRANDSATYLAALSNDYVTHTQITANIDVVQDNVATLTTTVDNFGSYANTNLDTKSNVSATYIQLNANIDVVQDNVASITARSDAFGTYANTTFSTVSNAEALATGIATKLDSSDYTASDVLTKIKTVDGAGSGLDADLLDGQTSTYFAVEATRSANASALAAGIAGITPIGTSDISNGAVTIDKLAATLDLGALS